VNPNEAPMSKYLFPLLVLLTMVVFV